MFDRVIRLSIGNSVFVNLLFILVIVGGAWAAFQLPREQFPEISLDRVSVTTAYPGATAEDVEELITKPIEEALEDVADIDRLESRSSEGISLITIRFLDGTDLISARSEVEKAVGTVDDLPDDSETPSIRELKLELPVVAVALLGDIGATQISDRIADELRNVQGVATVAISGLAERKIFVDLDERQLRQVGMQPAEIMRAIQQANANVPAGSVELAGQDVFVKTEERIRSAQDVRRIPIKPGSSLRVGDVARISDVADPGDSLFWVNGQPAVKFTVGREETADPLEIYGRVKELLPDLVGEVPPGMELVMADDYSEPIRDRLDTVTVNAISGALLVTLVLFVMSGMRQALLALVGMPVSYFAATFLMDRAGMSINVVSTFGLLIATGIIVDDAIVVIENVQRHLEMGKSRVKATFIGTKEVLLPVTVAVLTTCLAFMPLTMVGGTMGRVMRILPLVVVFCLAGSLFEAIFILPGHLAEFASTDAHQSRTARLGERMKRVYRPVLAWAIRRRWITLVLVTVGFGGVGVLASTMPFQFGAPGKPFELQVDYEIMPGLDKTLTKQQGEAIDALVRKHLDEKIQSTTLRVGSILDRDNGLTTIAANQGQLRWEFILDDEALAAYPDMIEELRMSLATNPDLGRHRVQEVEAGPPSGAAITARVRGRSIADLNRAVSDIKLALYGIPGIVDIRDNYGSGRETFRVRVDQDRAARYGLTQLDVAQAVRTAIDGTVAEQVSIDEESVDIVVRYQGARARSRRGLSDLVIPTPQGHIVRLDSVAMVERTREVGFVRREDGLRTVAVLADVDTDVITAYEAAQKLETFWNNELIDRYPGMSLSFGGEADELRSSLDDLPAAFALALLMIYLVLALQFRSYVQPLIILSAVPFGLMGAVLGLGTMGYNLSLMAMFGIVALVGIVVNDSLVMVDFINQRRAGGVSASVAAQDGALHRLRPIISTTLTTCLGLLPLALGLGGKDEVLAPMAVAISAGLGFATLLVLVVVPALYMAVEDVRGLAARLVPRRNHSTPEPLPDDEDVDL